MVGNLLSLPMSLDDARFLAEKAHALALPLIQKVVGGHDHRRVLSAKLDCGLLEGDGTSGLAESLLPGQQPAALEEHPGDILHLELPHGERHGDIVLLLPLCRLHLHLGHHFPNKIL